MTRDELIELALQCGVWIPIENGQEREQTIDRLQRLVGRAAAAECEAHAGIIYAAANAAADAGRLREYELLRQLSHAIRDRGAA